jgi:hypothetical protein
MLTAVSRPPGGMSRRCDTPPPGLPCPCAGRYQQIHGLHGECTQGHAGNLQPDATRVGGAAGRGQKVAAFDGLGSAGPAHGEAYSLSGPALDTDCRRLEQHLDALVSKQLEESAGDVGILARSQLARPAPRALPGPPRERSDIDFAKQTGVDEGGDVLQRFDVLGRQHL